jgi:hypothetical protein
LNPQVDEIALADLCGQYGELFGKMPPLMMGIDADGIRMCIVAKDEEAWLKSLPDDAPQKNPDLLY